MFLPFGFQLKLVMSNSPFVILLALFVSTFVVNVFKYKCEYLKFLSTKITSLFSFSSFSSFSVFGFFIKNAILFPSGDHLNEPAPCFSKVNCHASPPLVLITQICCFSDLELKNARNLPSGEKRG